MTSCFTCHDHQQGPHASRAPCDARRRHLVAFPLSDIPFTRFRPTKSLARDATTQAARAANHSQNRSRSLGAIVSLFSGLHYSPARLAPPDTRRLDSDSTAPPSLPCSSCLPLHSASATASASMMTASTAIVLVLIFAALVASSPVAYDYDSKCMSPQNRGS